MGCICPNTDETTSIIDRQQRRNHFDDERKIKLLFLGAGGSGKSTLFKQLRLIYGNGLSEDLRQGYTRNIYINLVSGIKVLLEGNLEMADTDESKSKELELSNKGQKAKIKACDEKTRRLIEEVLIEDSISPQAAEVIKQAWADPGIQMTWENRSKLQIQDTLEYFVENVERISTPGYIPNKDDVLNVRAVTTGIVEEDMKIENRIFHIVDVGGQRSERRKWIQCFDDVTGLIFVVSLIAYNQVLYEDETTNRMKESLNLFKNTMNGKKGQNFEDACVVIFLNKDDLFREALKKYPITECFTEYRGELTEEAQYNYIKEKYKAQVAPRQTFVHRTCATNTKTIGDVFNLVNLAIIEKAMTNIGLLMP